MQKVRDVKIRILYTSWAWTVEHGLRAGEKRQTQSGLVNMHLIVLKFLELVMRCLSLMREMYSCSTEYFNEACFG